MGSASGEVYNGLIIPIRPGMEWRAKPFPAAPGTCHTPVKDIGFSRGQFRGSGRHVELCPAGLEDACGSTFSGGYEIERSPVRHFGGRKSSKSRRRSEYPRQAVRSSRRTAKSRAGFAGDFGQVWANDCLVRKQGNCGSPSGSKCAEVSTSNDGWNMAFARALRITLGLELTGRPARGLAPVDFFQRFFCW